MADKRITFLIGANIKNFERNLSRAQRTFKNFGSSLKNTGRTLTRSLTLPIGIAGLAAVKMAADFETSMRKIETLVGISSENVQNMTGDVIELSNETGRASKELSEALFVITSAGQRGAESMQILNRSSKASAIGLGETKDIARAVTAILNAYGKENISAARATDQLVSIVREGNLEAADLAPVLGRVIGMASHLDISFAEVGASIATFTRLGVGAEEAVVGLRGIMNTLIKPSTEARETLRKVGMTFAELREQVREKGLALTLIDLVEKFQGNEEALGELIPNVRALAAVLGTAGAQGETYSQIARNIENSTGILNEGFEKISEDTGFKFLQALQQLKNAAIELGTMLLPVANKILDWAKRSIKWFSSLSTHTKKMVLVFAGLAAAIGPALIALGTLVFILGSISLPILGVIAAIGGLGAAFLYVWDNWQALKERISDWSWWKNMLIEMAQFFIEHNFFSPIIDAYNALMISIGRYDKLIADPFQMLVDELEKLKEEPPKFEHEFGSMKDAVVNGFKEMMAAALGFGSVLGLGIPEAETSTGLKAIPNRPFKAPQVGLTKKDLSAAWGVDRLIEHLKELEKASIEATKKANDAFEKMKGKIVDVGDALQTVINTAIIDISEKLGDFITGNLDTGIQGFFKNMLYMIGDFATQLGKIVVGIGTTLLVIETQWANPIAVIAAGAGLIIAGVALKNLMTKGIGGQGMAEGGIIPPGFANDTYPARLSSGEMVIPEPEKLPSFGGKEIYIAETSIDLRTLHIRLKKIEEAMNRA
ncbi:MAG: phage tail tape measure protein [Calditrichaeota bacterium]|nr:phage tail tape measure protein [Calditrichota bacterium]